MRAAPRTDMPTGTVLVADDDAAMRDSLCEVLEQEGHEVVLAENGKEALAVLRSRQDVAVVLLDVMMPEMNGLELLAVKMRDETISRIPVVLMTAHQPDVRQIVGVTSIFSKPFRTEALLEEVYRLSALKSAASVV